MKILSFGEILFDFVNGQKTVGGAPFNFAVHAKAEGAEVWLVSAVGKDDDGEQLRTKIINQGVSDEFVCTLPKPSGRCIVTLDKDGVPSYNLLSGVAYDFIEYPDLKDKFNAVAFGTLALRSSKNKATLERLLGENRFDEIYCDLNLREPFFTLETVEFCLKNATVLKISKQELDFVCEKFTLSTPSLIIEKFNNIRLVIVTDGERGATAFTKEGEVFYQPAVKTKVVSTVGAGDSFGGAFLVEYLRSKDIEEALKKGAQRSAFVCAYLSAIP